ncbi:LysR family transcriptional regulator [Oceanibacterium hippocampi]|uniref:HTH-type transcriptional regulator DmlR n=1 Tax=Oceanibacterium hippocampi TaxID=745714 RepID=A0A1Y5U174_9PROT|nr:LysR family transcriptional regulator [Oceanibacterium hippocampi]SLN76042.1 HTH-type transcriptional regulator DmlR [Oceanibacterium hippocampi]
MHPVDDMTIFVRVVDRQGFSTAGRELRMTTAVVSSRIAKLEQRLGHRLLNRTTRRVGLTQEGQIYYEHCQRVLADIQEVDQRLAEIKRRPAGALCISAPVALGRLHIAPMIPDFVDRNPDVQARLQITDRVVNLVEENVDVAIRKGVLPSSADIVRRIAPDLRVVCGAPGYFERHGIPRQPEDLKSHNCLLLRFPGSRRYSWQFLKDGSVGNLPVSGALDSDSSDVLIDWALQGAGLIMKSVWDVSPHLQSGALVTVLEPYWPRGLSLQALMPPRPQPPAKTRAFIDYLVRAFRDHPVARLTEPGQLPRAS